MKNRKINLDMLENANEDLLEQLSDEDKFFDAEKERMFELSIKYYYGEVPENKRAKKVDMQAEVKNKNFLRKSTAAAAVLMIIMLNAVVIGALKTKTNNGITNYGNGNDQVVSSITSDTKKENVAVTSDNETASVNKKISDRNSKKETAAAIKSNIEKESSTSVSAAGKISEVYTESVIKNSEGPVQDTIKETEQVICVTAEPEVSIKEQETVSEADEITDTDILVRILASQKYISSSDSVRSDFSFSPDENTTYFIEQSGQVWKYSKTAGQNGAVEKAVMNNEDFEIVKEYFQTYGKRIFNIYPIDTEYLEMKLNTLEYFPLTGDKTPKYSFSPDGIIRYEIDLENMLVRRVVTASDGETVTEEAKLPADVYSAAEKCIAFYGDSVFGLI